jgi:DNA processing protein
VAELLMNAWKNRLITLQHCPYLTHTKIRSILQKDPRLNQFFTQTSKEIALQYSINPNQANSIYRFLNQNNIANILTAYKEHQIQIISQYDETYPRLLKEIFDPPQLLYMKGNIQLLNRRMLGVVGSRRITPYGQHTLQKIIPPLIHENITIVSGLAKGVDTFAHRLAINNNGSTIAVLGSGLFHIYPKENQQIADEMAKSQLLISEYPPGTSPRKWHFPMRNRIISGLGEGVLIIEAKEKSGSLITADQAMEQGREVFAVPGSILTDTSTGTNYLIQQGAKLVTNHIDILEELQR